MADKKWKLEFVVHLRVGTVFWYTVPISWTEGHPLKVISYTRTAQTH
jgi:hypothetical protein